MDPVTKAILQGSFREAQAHRAYEKMWARKVAQADNDDAMLVAINRLMTR